MTKHSAACSSCTSLFIPPDRLAVIFPTLFLQMRGRGTERHTVVDNYSKLRNLTLSRLGQTVIHINSFITRSFIEHLLCARPWVPAGTLESIRKSSEAPGLMGKILKEPLRV